MDYKTFNTLVERVMKHHLTEKRVPINVDIHTLVERVMKHHLTEKRVPINVDIHEIGVDGPEGLFIRSCQRVLRD